MKNLTAKDLSEGHVVIGEDGQVYRFIGKTLNKQLRVNEITYESLDTNFKFKQQNPLIVSKFLSSICRRGRTLTRHQLYCTIEMKKQISKQKQEAGNWPESPQEEKKKKAIIKQLSLIF